MASNYRRSRLARIEESRAKKSAFIYIVLTIIVCALIFFYGLSVLTNFAGFVANFTGSSNPIVHSDKTPPAPPILSEPPEFTNSDSVTISGSAEPGSTVRIYANNGSPQEVLANADGGFSKTLQLETQKTTVFAVAEDSAGNESENSESFEINLDKTEPDLEIITPGNNSTFYGEKEKNVKIEGQTEASSSVTINDRIAIVSGDGKFNYNLTLQDGENTLIIKATDPAGNETEETLTLIFNP